MKQIHYIKDEDVFDVYEDDLYIKSIEISIEELEELEKFGVIKLLKNEIKYSD